MYADPEMRVYFPDGVLTEEQTANELEYFLSGHPEDPRLGLWACEFKRSGEWAGRCGLLKWQIDGLDEIEIAYMIDKPHWGQGLGAEAARGLVRYAREELNIQRLIALVDPEHQASLRTAQAAGLTYEKSTIMDGLPTSIMAITFA